MREMVRILESLPQGDKIANPVIIIPSYNNGTYLKNFIQQLSRLSLTRYVVIDGGSQDPTTVRLLEQLGRANRVVTLPDNPGPRYFFESKDMFDCLPRIFCVSDPDLAFNNQLPGNFLKSLYELTLEFSVGKVGLALSLDGELIEDNFFFYGGWQTIREWEAKYWQNRVPNSLNLEVYRAEVDTTFALYNKDFLQTENFFESLRVAGTFSATHLPWLRQNPLGKTSKEEESATVGTWTTWSSANSLTNIRSTNERNEHKLRLMENSLSWRITAPLRGAGRLLGRMATKLRFLVSTWFEKR